MLTAAVDDLEQVCVCMGCSAAHACMCDCMHAWVCCWAAAQHEVYGRCPGAQAHPLHGRMAAELPTPQVGYRRDQYKRCANLLEAVGQLMEHFEKYRCGHDCLQQCRGACGRARLPAAVHGCLRQNMTACSSAGCLWPGF